MGNLISIGISDMKISKSPGSLVTYALGSCIGICMYDPILRVGALGHIMLPNCPIGCEDSNQFKYADSCVPIMLQEMLKLGCNKARITARIAGGARMFNVSGDSTFGAIGQRNTKAVKEALAKVAIRLLAEDTGADYGRTVYFHTETGQVEVRSHNKPTKNL